jgi:hypothetical protein
LVAAKITDASTLMGFGGVKYFGECVPSGSGSRSSRRDLVKATVGGRLSRKKAASALAAFCSLEPIGSGVAVR